ncbi:MAG: hypothetical protein NVS3B3_21510 [Aquirhabdus sp.]
MLAELQHLQTLISRLTEQLQAKRLENQQLQEELAASTVRPEDEQARQALLQQLEQLQHQYSQSEQNQLDLANRHAELELTHQQLQNDHQALIQLQSEKEQRISTLEQEKLGLENEALQFTDAKVQLEAERDALLRKNDFAKQKVEAIIHRLSMLGQTSTETSH